MVWWPGQSQRRSASSQTGAAQCSAMRSHFEMVCHCDMHTKHCTIHEEVGYRHRHTHERLSQLRRQWEPSAPYSLQAIVDQDEVNLVNVGVFTRLLSAFQGNDISKGKGHPWS